jgi:hypothetical protein
LSPEEEILMAHLPPLEADPVFAEVQRNLTMDGSMLSSLVTSGKSSGGNEIMSIVHLMATGQHHAAPAVPPPPAPSSSVGPVLGGVVAGLATGLAAGAMAYSAGKGGVKPGAGGQPPAPPSELPNAKTAKTAAPVTTASKDPVPPSPTVGKAPEAPAPAKLPDAGKYTFTLSPEAAKGLPINPDNVDTATGKVKVTPTPTSLTAIPYAKMNPADAEKQGFQKVTYNGADFWLSKKDMATYAAWNKAYATTGGLKPGAATVTPVETPAKPKSSFAPPSTTTPPTPATALSPAFGFKFQF